jgi:hypothetical protein
VGNVLTPSMVVLLPLLFSSNSKGQAAKPASVSLLVSTNMDTLFNSSLSLLLSLCSDASPSSLLPADCFRDGESSLQDANWFSGGEKVGNFRLLMLLPVNCVTRGGLELGTESK